MFWLKKLEKFEDDADYDRSNSSMSLSSSLESMSLSSESISLEAILRCWKVLAQKICDALICEQFVQILIKMYKGELLKPLEVVVMLGEAEMYPELIKFILENEDPDTEIWVSRLFYNLTPLDLAALYGFTDVVEILLKRRGDPPRLPENFGFLKTPIHFAALNGHLDTVKLLVRFTDDPLGGPKYCSPIHWAAGNGHLDILKYLVEFTNDPLIANDCGQTPFHLAAKAGSLECLQFLAGLDTPIILDTSIILDTLIILDTDGNGETPIHKAAFNGHLDCLKFLVKFTNNPIVQNMYGRTPIHLAAERGHLDCIKFLVKGFTDVRRFDWSQSLFGKTPIELARWEGHDEVVQFLEEYCKKW